MGADVFALPQDRQKAAEDWPHSKTLARHTSRCDGPQGFGVR